jgi:photosystem II stability/assembly factor-like uncharacterized protein
MKQHTLFLTLCAQLAATYPLIAQSWTSSSAPKERWFGLASSADGNQLVAAAYTNGIYLSSDSGANWKKTSAPAEPWFGDIASSADGRRLVAAANRFDDSTDTPLGGPIYNSTDGGNTWNKTSAPTLRWYNVASSADGNRVAAAARYDGIYTSADAGATWTKAALPALAWDSVTSSADGVTWMAGIFEGGGLYISTDSGASWVKTTAPVAGWNFTACSPDGSKLAAANIPESAIYVSSDTGKSWKRSNAPRLTWISLKFAADGTKLVAVAPNAPVYLSDDLGQTWTAAKAPSIIWFKVVSSADGTKMAASAPDWYTGTHGPGPIYTWQGIQPPSLSLSPSGDNAVISWILPAMDFVLQQTRDLVTTNWSDVLIPPTLNLTNLHNEISVPRASGNRYFRLKH